MLGVAIFFLLAGDCGPASPGSNTTTVTPDHSTLVPELLGSENTADHLGLLPLLSLMVFLAAFFLGLGPIPFILNVELIPSEARVGDVNNIRRRDNVRELITIYPPGSVLLPGNHLQLAGVLAGGPVHAPAERLHRPQRLLLHLLGHRAAGHSLHQPLCAGD